MSNEDCEDGVTSNESNAGEDRLRERLESFVFEEDLDLEVCDNVSVERKGKMPMNDITVEAGGKEEFAYELYILKEGYSYTEANDAQRADGSITLLKHVHNTQHIIVDLGLPHDAQTIRDGLATHGLSVDDISVVICTHGHSDHVGNLNLFPNTMCIVGFDISTSDRYTPHSFFTQRHPYQYSVNDERTPYVINPAVVVLPTPGHEISHVSVLARNVKHYHTVLIAGDLFESEEDIGNSNLWQANSCNAVLQSDSRYYAMSYDLDNVTRYIVPGHGAMFRVTAEHVQHICTQNRQVKPEMLTGTFQNVSQLNDKVTEVGEVAKGVKYVMEQMTYTMNSLIAASRETVEILEQQEH